MIYNLPEIESEQIKSQHELRVYKTERDRLKPRFFIFIPYPKINFLGLSISDAKGYVYADIFARYNRYIGNNVLFSIGYNNNHPSVLKMTSNLSKPLYAFSGSGYESYQKELKLLDIGFDKEKEIFANSADYVEFIQNIFQFLYDKGLIELRNEFCVYNEEKYFTSDEYYQKNNKYYSNKNETLDAANKNIYTLNLSTIKKEIKHKIDNSDIEEKYLKKINERLGYEEGILINANTTADVILSFKMSNPEYICGISYVVLNPKYIDIKPFIDSNEVSLLTDFSNDFIFSGNLLINHLTNKEVPIFISTLYDEKVHLGIPSISDFDENIALKYDLSFEPIIDYINDEKILVNSCFLNGYSPIEAKEIIIDKLINSGYASKYEELKLNYLNITSPARYGIPIPLYNDLSFSKIPLIYDVKHDIKLEDGEVVDRFVVKEFLNDSFVSSLLPNIIRLKTETGIIPFDTKEALNEITNFPNVNYAIIKEDELIDNLFWNIIMSSILKKYYVSSYEMDYKNIKIVKELKLNNDEVMSYENHNMISLSTFIANYGSTLLRYFYAINGNVDEEYIYNSELLSDYQEDIEKIIKVYYYQLDEYCLELDYEYQILINSTNSAMKKFDIKKYTESVMLFVKKVHEIKRISRAQSKGLLIILSVILPSLAEQIKCDVFNLKEPLIYYSFPE